MPDTYTSQFSGEEIDSALRAAQIISGASTPAELRNKLEIRGDTIPVSAEDSTLISEALTKIPTTSGGGVNPNLLDNWYFGRPVNQRNGYYIPAGVKYNTLSWTEAGTTDKAYPVIGYSGQDPLIAVNGTNYIVGKSAQVPGYCTTGYTVDRWKLSQWNTDEVAAKLKKTGLNISGSADGKANSTYIEENIDFPFAGKTVTISAIISEINKTSNTLCLFLRANNTLLHSHPIKSTGLVSTTYTFANDFDGIVGFEIGQGGSEGGSGSCDFTILAAKLELGSTQTLARKESEKWVLNEIPDFGEQLRRCQRFLVRYDFNSQRFFGVLNVDNENGGQGMIFTPVPMRTTPTIIGNLGAYSTDNNLIVTPSVQGTQGGLVWLNANITNTKFVNTPKSSLLFTPDTLYLAADL